MNNEQMPSQMPDYSDYSGKFKKIMRLFYVLKGFLFFLRILFILIGVAFLGTGGYSIYQNMNAVKNNIHVQGFVAKNLHQHNISTGGYDATPIIDFTTLTGQTQEFTSNVTSQIEHQIGDKVEVSYDPQNPQNGQINDPSNIWSPQITNIILGIIFLIVGIWILLAGRKRRQMIKNMVSMYKNKEPQSFNKYS